jgi:hypothetical protein
MNGDADCNNQCALHKTEEILDSRKENLNVTSLGQNIDNKMFFSRELILSTQINDLQLGTEIRVHVHIVWFLNLC